MNICANFVRKFLLTLDNAMSAKPFIAVAVLIILKLLEAVSDVKIMVLVKT